MRRPSILSRPLPSFALWEKARVKRIPLAFEMELTARCNNNCRHCYINLPAGDREAKAREMDFGFIMDLADQAVSLGALWCLLTGGEPLLREDFAEIYLGLRKKGLLVSVFTNAALIGEKETELFRSHPPRAIEVSVYGVTSKTEERVTRTPRSNQAFRKGLDRLLKAGIKVRFKTMALRSNLSELAEIAAFCRARSADFFRFDPMIHLRIDQNQVRNEEIKNERLAPDEIIALERSDPERLGALERACDSHFLSERAARDCRHLIYCGAGQSSFLVGWDGRFALCPSLRHPDCLYDLKQGSLRQAWEQFAPRVLSMESNNSDYLEKCGVCPIVNLCLWCPAHAHLETGELDKPVDYFCEVAHARSLALQGTIQGQRKDHTS